MVTFFWPGKRKTPVLADGTAIQCNPAGDTTSYETQTSRNAHRDTAKTPNLSFRANARNLTPATPQHTPVRFLPTVEMTQDKGRRMALGPNSTPTPPFVISSEREKSSRHNTTTHTRKISPCGRNDTGRGMVVRLNSVPTKPLSFRANARNLHATTSQHKP